MFSNIFNYKKVPLKWKLEFFISNYIFETNSKCKWRGLSLEAVLRIIVGLSILWNGISADMATKDRSEKFLVSAFKKSKCDYGVIKSSDVGIEFGTIGLDLL